LCIGNSSCWLWCAAPQWEPAARRALLVYAWSSSLASNGDVTAPSRMEQCVEVGGGPSLLVHSGHEMSYERDFSLHRQSERRGVLLANRRAAPRGLPALRHPH
jgi:hypothetical protein